MVIMVMLELMVDLVQKFWKFLGLFPSLGMKAIGANVLVRETDDTRHGFWEESGHDFGGLNPFLRQYCR